MSLEALRNRHLTDIRNQMDEAGRQLQRDLTRGGGPALDAWKRCYTQAEAALGPLLPKDGEGA